MRRRLYLQIYLAFLGVTLCCVIVAGILGSVFGTRREQTVALVSAVAEVVDADLSATPAARRHQEAELWADRLDSDFGIWGPEGELVVRTTEALEPPPVDAELGWFHDSEGHGMRVRLEDGRWFIGMPRHGDFGRGLARFIFALVLLMLVMAAGCYLIARTITRRLETLRDGVDRWGAGDLGTRVAVQGRDEVAELAGTFNQAASRVAELMTQQRRVLAHASHELRSPLTRIRMALELLADPSITMERRAKLVVDTETDIQELDELVGDVLLAARLEDSEQPKRFESVALEPLLREEALRVGAKLTATPTSIEGNPRMLRRLFRNLFENAKRYGEGAAIEARLEADGSHVRIVVADAGPGIAESERERVFEPFYRAEGHREGEDGGVGLGLSLVRQIAEHHGGSVRYEANARGGSRFQVRLPRGRTP